MQHPQPSRPQLVYLAFGPATYHQEACFSIVSALAHLDRSAGETLDIQVYTDNAQPYARLPVTVHLLDEATRQAWKVEPGLLPPGSCSGHSTPLYPGFLLVEFNLKMCPKPCNFSGPMRLMWPVALKKPQESNQPKKW